MVGRRINSQLTPSHCVGCPGGVSFENPSGLGFLHGLYSAFLSMNRIDFAGIFAGFSVVIG